MFSQFLEYIHTHTLTHIYSVHSVFILFYVIKNLCGQGLTVKTRPVPDSQVSACLCLSSVERFLGGLPLSASEFS